MRGFGPLPPNFRLRGYSWKRCGSTFAIGTAHSIAIIGIDRGETRLEVLFGRGKEPRDTDGGKLRHYYVHHQRVPAGELARFDQVGAKP